MKKFLTVFSIIIITSCNNYSINTTPEISNLPLLVTPSQTTNPKNQPISFLCPSILPLDNNLPIEGSLIYQDNRASSFILSFPSLSTKEILRDYLFIEGSTTPNGRFFSTNSTLYDWNTGSYLGEYLHVLDSEGNIIVSDAWDSQWTEMPKWINIEELFVSFQNNTALFYNPFHKSTRTQSIKLPDDQNLRIENIDPSLNTVVYSYYENNSESDFQDINNALRVLGVNNKQVVLTLDNEFSYLASPMMPSHDKSKFAIVTVTPNESKIHSEILVVNNQTSSYTQISDFRSFFDEILIVGIEWSLDDKEIYFWAVTNTHDRVLFSIDIQSKKIKQYCFIGSKNNSIIWVNNMPGFYFINDSRNYADIYNSDILLVDSQNNKAYFVAKDISILGWLTSP